MKKVKKMTLFYKWKWLEVNTNEKRIFISPLEKEIATTDILKSLLISEHSLLDIFGTYPSEELSVKANTLKVLFK